MTSIIGAVLNKGGGMIGWAQNITIEGFQDLVARGYHIPSFDFDQLKALLWEYGYTPYQKRDAAGDRGSAAHDILEVALKEGHAAAEAKLATIEDPEHQGYARSALNWVEDTKPKPLLIEEPVVSFQHWYAGTLDFLWTNYKTENHPQRKVSLTDLKTSKSVYDSHEIQLDAYELALREHGEHVDAQAVLRVQPEPNDDFPRGYEYHVSEPNPELWLHIRELYRLTRGE